MELIKSKYYFNKKHNYTIIFIKIIVKTLVFNIAVKYSPYSISLDIAFNYTHACNLPIYSTSEDTEYACGSQTPTNFTVLAS